MTERGVSMRLLNIYKVTPEESSVLMSHCDHDNMNIIPDLLQGKAIGTLMCIDHLYIA